MPLVFFITGVLEIKTRPGDRHEITLGRGRINYEYHQAIQTDTFYIAPMDFRADFPLDYHIYPTWWFVRIPLWIPFLACLILGAFPWYIRFRHQPGLCNSCGYLLHALQTSDDGTCVCPECGTNQYRD